MVRSVSILLGGSHSISGVARSQTARLSSTFLNPDTLDRFRHSVGVWFGGVRSLGKVVKEAVGRLLGAGAVAAYGWAIRRWLDVLWDWLSPEVL